MFNPKNLNIILFGNNAALKKDVRAIITTHYKESLSLVTKEEKRDHSLKVVEALAAKKYGAAAYDEEYGGTNSFYNYFSIFEILCEYNLNYAIKFGVQFGLFGGAISSLGTKFHHDKYLKAIGEAKLLGCFAMTETGHGSNVKDLETMATYNHASKELTIHSPGFNSGKEYIGNALHGRLAVVFCQLMVDTINHGIHAVVVPYRDDAGKLLNGIRVEDCGYKMGLNGIDNGRLWFENVIVPKENLLNKYGDIDENGKYISKIENPNKRFFTMLGALVGGRICVGVGGISAARRALSIAINYSLRRKQFKADDGTEETLLMDYPTHQHRLMPLLVKTIVYQNALNNLALQYENHTEDDVRKIETKAAGLKALATWHCTRTIQECREACGGKGYLNENFFADLKADSDIFTTFEGDNTVLMQLVGKGLLTEFNQSFHDDRFNAVMNYVGGKIKISLAELNIYYARKTSSDHILDEEFLSNALRYKEKKMLISLADRMREYIDKKVSPYDAFLKCQVHLVDAARSYIERLAYREMIKTIDKLEHSAEKEILKKVNRFYALSLIMEHRYFYLESDYMDGSKTKAIRRVYSDVMLDLRNNVEGILESFGFDKEMVEIKR